ncbi:MAG: glycoside hydrolase family 3 C-terminal domain-containing protein [Prevotellaceae bacterium]|jgi:beta-glucosidase-like glycosyl hydrolase|nr:glycoside hydrolase family 3 C-terminal domain-containing protein [Prevotellaceae bacterium]
MKNVKIMLFASVFLASLVCASAQQTKRQWVDSKIKTMTLRQQIAQLFVISCYPERGDEYLNKISDIISNEQVGGIIWGECSPTMCINTLNRFQSLVNIPLLVTIDAEWGVAMRLDSVVKFPQQLTLGAIQDNNLIYDFGVEVARQCREIGVHFNFAPVVDVNNNPNNPVINMRSFGENKYKVTEKAYSYMKGMQDGGILTSLKHFPGHGDTDKDSHKELPSILHDKKHINDTELYPFKELIKRGATGVMTAHLRIPALSSEKDVPASQSKEICTDLLQKKLKFKGLVVTDALEMKGALYNRDTSKVAMYSLIAGNDILEIPINIKKSIDEIEKAVKNGEISEKYIIKKCKKILAAKYDLGLHKGFEPINSHGILEKLNTQQAKTLRYKLAEASLTLLSNKNILPLNSTKKITYIEIGNGKTFKNQIKEYCAVDTLSIKSKATTENIDSLAAKLSDAQTIIIGYHNSPSRRSYTNFGIDSLIIDFIDNLTTDKNVVLVFFGNPYAISNFKNPEKTAAIVVAYDNSDEAQICSAKAIFGKQKFAGKLPVTINNIYKEDFSVQF